MEMTASNSTSVKPELRRFMTVLPPEMFRCGLGRHWPRGASTVNQLARRDTVMKLRKPLIPYSQLLVSRPPLTRSAPFTHST